MWSLRWHKFGGNLWTGLKKSKWTQHGLDWTHPLDIKHLYHRSIKRLFLFTTFFPQEHWDIESDLTLYMWQSWGCKELINLGLNNTWTKRVLGLAPSRVQSGTHQCSRLKPTYEFHFEGFSNYNPYNWRAGLNWRYQSKNIEKKYKTHIELVHEVCDKCFHDNVKT